MVPSRSRPARWARWASDRERRDCSLSANDLDPGGQLGHTARQQDLTIAEPDDAHFPGQWRQFRFVWCDLCSTVTREARGLEGPDLKTHGRIASAMDREDCRE